MATDYLGDFCPGVIVAIRRTTSKNYAKVRFDGWSSEYDEWKVFPSESIRHRKLKSDEDTPAEKINLQPAVRQSKTKPNAMNAVSSTTEHELGCSPSNPNPIDAKSSESVSVSEKTRSKLGRPCKLNSNELSTKPAMLCIQTCFYNRKNAKQFGMVCGACDTWYHAACIGRKKMTLEKQVAVVKADDRFDFSADRNGIAGNVEMSFMSLRFNADNCGPNDSRFAPDRECS